MPSRFGRRSPPCQLGFRRTLASLLSLHSTHWNGPLPICVEAVMSSLSPAASGATTKL